MFVIEWESRPDPYDVGPRLQGPYPTREEAAERARQLAARSSGSWSYGVSPLAAP
jgi:hypothetical protein